jgi:hypothetical protein
MNAVDMIRTAVLKTNPYWPFSSLNKMPYHLAIKAFIRACKKFPEIKSAYLRPGLAEGILIPGLSDIDLTIIIDRTLTVEKEFSFLHSFWKNHDSMKTLFPMFGEIEIFNEEHIGSWTRFGVPGYKARNWRLVYGIETLKSNYIESPRRLAMDSLNFAFWFYSGYFIRKFSQQKQPNYLASQDLKRLGIKILRCLNHTDNESQKQNIELRLDDKTAVLCSILKALEEDTRCFTPDNNQTASKKRDTEWLTDISFYNTVHFDNRALGVGELTSCDDAIESIMLDYHKRIFIVLKDGLNAAEMRSCIDNVRRVFAGEDAILVIASSCIFKHMLWFYDPFLYTHLITYRTIAYGRDLLSEIQPPDMHSFIRKVIEQTTNILAFTQSRALILAPGPHWFSGRAFDSIVERSLFIKLYLEKGVIRPWHNQLLTESQKHYPDYYKKLGELKENTDHLSNGALSREAFGLLKGIANDIHESISTSDVVDNLFKIDESKRNYP